MAKVPAKPEWKVFHELDYGPLYAPIIGANVDGKPNFMPGAYLGRINHVPDDVHVSIALRFARERHTLKGIRQNQTFSMNVPVARIEPMMEALANGSGATRPDKVEKAGVKIVYGKLGNAPMIAQSPVSYECSVLHQIDCGSHILIVGRIEETHVDEDCIVDGLLDYNKVQPLFRLHIQHKSDKGKPLTDTRDYFAMKLLDEDIKEKKLVEVTYHSPKHYWQNLIPAFRQRAGLPPLPKKD